MLKKTIKKFALVPLCFFVFSSTTSKAFCLEIDSKTEKATTDLRKGDKAPFEGILLSYMLAAEIKENCSPEVTKKKCDILIKEAVDLVSSQCTKNTEVIQTKYDALQIKHNDIVSAKDKEIEILRDKLKPSPWYESPKLWFGIGFIAGSASVVAIVSSLSK